MKKKFKGLFTEFLESEQASGVVLLLCTAVSLAVANSEVGTIYNGFWQTKAALGPEWAGLGFTVRDWVNDGLMAVFFLLIGLEIEREIYIGELSDLRSASLPVFAALGGMIAPATIHFLFNGGTPAHAGAGIPIATDIAFALGAFALLGHRVPPALKVFLAALAIIDDLGAVAVIAFFYAGGVKAAYLGAALSIFAALVAFNRLGVRCLAFYLIPGIFLWYFMHHSGVHAAIAGVLLAFAIPFHRRSNSPSQRLQRFLTRPVAFIIMPLFALANTGIALPGDWLLGLAAANSLGILAGLIVGKPLGITLFSYLAVQTGVSRLPRNVTWRHIAATGFLGGIGFTMSIFITLLAFHDPDLVRASKIAILLGSLIAGTIGFVFLRSLPIARDWGRH